MRSGILLFGLILASLAISSYADESLRARMANFDWVSFEESLDDGISNIVTQPRERDFPGLKRDTFYFVGYQAVAVGILYLMPEGISGWSEESKDEYSIGRWWENVTHPSWDKDDYFINYVTHPYWGAGYYVRARDRGYSRRSSFWYSTFLSTLYEYGVEALFEQPSFQDLVVTPIGGALLGDYFFDVRQRILARHAMGGEVTTKDRWALVLTDPLGAINRKTDQIFGRDTEVSVRSFVTIHSMQGQHGREVHSLSSRWTDPPTHDAEAQQLDTSIFGVEFNLRF